MNEPDKWRRMEQILQTVNELPSLPSILTQIINILDDPDSTVEDLQKIIGQDQALTIKVLKIANSAYYGFPRKIATLSEAVVILGFNTLRSLVFAASAYSIFNKEN